MRAIATITTKDGMTLKMIEFIETNTRLTGVEYAVERMNMEVERAFIASPKCDEWQTIVLTLERGS